MWWAKSLFLLFTIEMIFSCNISLAQGIQYSTPPVCIKNKVICSNSNEVPTCLVLHPKVHIENILNVDGKNMNRYQPSCKGLYNNLVPSCIDIYSKHSTKLVDAPTDVILDCVEFVKCYSKKDSKKIISECSNGKVPKCLGDNDLPNCAEENICKNNSLAICDYIWEANASIYK